MKFIGNLLTALVALVALALGFWEITNPPKEAEEEETGEVATAQVKVIALEKGAMSPLIVGYGELLGSAGTTLEISLPIEVKVKRLFVAAGQVVNKGDPLVEIQPTAEVLLSLTQAKSALAAANKELDSVNHRIELHLATNSEQNSAEAAVIAAKDQLNNLIARGAGGARTIKAEGFGIVAQGVVNEHAFVPAGSPILSLVDTANAEARLGVSAEDASKLKPGQAVSVTTIEGSGEPVEGSLRSIGRAINPITHLVDVYVSLTNTASTLLLGAQVRGEFQETPIDGFVVPRSAVLPGDEGSFKLFVLEGDTAKEREATILYQQGDEVLLSAEGLHAGELAIILGNYELSDGDKAEQVKDEPEGKDSKEESTSQKEQE
jgi:membrane fusion protein, multidrug efflux system